MLYRVVLRNFEGVITTYTEPTDYKNECHCKYCKEAKIENAEGVSSLLQGKEMTIEPARLNRKERAHKH